MRNQNLRIAKGADLASARSVIGAIEKTTIRTAMIPMMESCVEEIITITIIETTRTIEITITITTVAFTIEIIIITIIVITNTEIIAKATITITGTIITDTIITTTDSIMMAMTTMETGVGGDTTTIDIIIILHDKWWLEMPQFLETNSPMTAM